MGRITIEIPQKLNRNYWVISEKSARAFLFKLEDLLEKESKIYVDEILDLWSDRNESVNEIVRNLRSGSNSRISKDG